MIQRLISIKSLTLVSSNERGVTTFRALLLLSLTFFTALTVVVYLVLGMMSLLMYLFPWAP